MLPLDGLTAKATPILKWAGGKSRLLKQYAPLLPDEFGTYYEPFAGGAALFFYLQNRGRLTKAKLGDSNAELVNCYRVVRDDVEALITLLAEHKQLHSKEHYYAIRALDRQTEQPLTPIERAARVIYLNKTCFNGLWRVNSKGQFNVPVGSYKNPPILDADNLRAASEALKEADLMHGDFRAQVGEAQPGDFVYFDPPYVPLNATANFTSYTADDFTLEDQRDLADLFATLDKRGCHVMLSNSDTPLVRELYTGFCIETVQANRAINSKASKRGPISELVVTNT